MPKNCQCERTHSVWGVLVESCCGDPTGVCAGAGVGEMANAKAVAGANWPFVKPRKRLNLQDNKGLREGNTMHKLTVRYWLYIQSPHLLHTLPFPSTGGRSSLVTLEDNIKNEFNCIFTCSELNMWCLPVQKSLPQ